jgi:hypothetical protein
VVFLSSHGSISFIFLAAIGEVVVPIVHLPVQSVYITTNVVALLDFVGRVMVFNAPFNNDLAILWQLVLLVEETGVPREIHKLKIMPEVVYYI